MNLNKLVDKAYEEKSIKEILDAPPSALEGLSKTHDEVLAKLNIKTVRDLGAFKYARRAYALTVLEDLES